MDYENTYSAYPDDKGNSYQANETIEDTSYEDSLFQHLTSETANFKHFNESKLGILEIVSKQNQIRTQKKE